MKDDRVIQVDRKMLWKDRVNLYINFMSFAYDEYETGINTKHFSSVY